MDYFFISDENYVMDAAETASEICEICEEIDNFRN